MGAWGFGIRDDDFVCDVVGVFEDLLKEGKTVRAATDAVTAKFAAATRDADDGPLLWIAVADVQWTYGELDPQVLRRVRDDFESGRSLAAWAEDPQGFSRRRAALEKFLAKLERPNARPKKPKTIVRAPKFQPGDCLSIRLPDGQYAAALVLAADHANAEYGTNLVGVLDYRSAEKPTPDVFRQRRWLVLPRDGDGVTTDVAWYHYMGFRSVKNRLEVVGRVELVPSDPKDSNTYRRWTGIGERAGAASAAGEGGA